MAFFSSPLSPETSQPKLSLEERRINYTITTAVAMLEVTLHNMSKNTLNASPYAYQDRVYLPKNSYSPEPSVIAAKQEEVYAAHAVHGGYEVPAYEASDPFVQKARSDVLDAHAHPIEHDSRGVAQAQAAEVSGQPSGNVISLTQKFLEANNVPSNGGGIDKAA